jgi:hypothetical protein
MKMSKVCSKCGESKPIEAFSKDRTRADGLAKWCKTCATKGHKEYYAKNNEKVKAYYKEYRAENEEELLAKKRAYYQANKERLRTYAKEYRLNNPEKVRLKGEKWRRKVNPEKIQAYDRKWRKNNPDKHRHRAAMYRAARMQRTPCWLTEDDKVLIQRKYTLAQKKTESTGERWVVDHILPLQGKLVSGFHVPANLRVIKYTTNARKSNKFVPV